MAENAPTEKTIQIQLRILHSAGVGAVSLSDIEALLAWQPVAASTVESTDSGMRLGLGRALSQAGQRLTERDQVILQNAFGIGPAEALGLHSRHEAIKKVTNVDWKQYRHAGFSHFLTRLTRALNETMLPSVANGTGLRAFHLRKLVDTYVVPTAATPERHLSTTRVVVADVDGLASWSTDWREQSASATGEPRIHLIGAGRLEQTVVALDAQSGTGYAGELTVHFRTPLKRSAEVEFTTIKHSQVDIVRYWQVAGPFYRGLGPSVRIDEYQLTIHFDPANMPHRVGRQNGVAIAESFSFDARLSTPVVVDDNSSVTYKWHNTELGRWYGFIWE